MGRATALALAGAGADVAVLARSEDALEQVAGEIQAMGRSGVAIPVDVQDAAAARASVGSILDALGGLDILVYATGWNIPGRALERLSPSDWELMQRTNLWGLYDVTQAALPALREAGARVVVISSAAVQLPDMSGVAYQSTKHGEAGFVHGMMHEEAGNGIRATVLFPGLDGDADDRPASGADAAGDGGERAPAGGRGRGGAVCDLAAAASVRA